MEWRSDPLQTMRPRRQVLWQRLIEALIASVSVRGYTETTIRHITELAGVNRTQFYFLFEDKEQCFLAAQLVVLQELEVRLRDPDYEHLEWPDAIRTGVEAFTETLDAEPSFARLALVESAGVGTAAVEQYRRALSKLIPHLDRGSAYSANGSSLPPAVGEMAVGSALAVLTRAIQDQARPGFAQLNPQVYFALLMPYIGPAEADSLVRGAYPDSV